MFLEFVKNHNTHIDSGVYLLSIILSLSIGIWKVETVNKKDVELWTRKDSADYTFGCMLILIGFLLMIIPSVMNLAKKLRMLN